MNKIGIASLLDDVNTSLALGLAAAMQPKGSQVVLCCPTDFPVHFPTLAQDLLAAIGLKQMTFHLANDEKQPVDKGLLIAYHAKSLEEDLEILRLRSPHFFFENWEILVVGEVPGGFTHQGLLLRNIIRGQLRDGLQNFFRRTDGLILEDESLLG